MSEILFEVLDPSDTLIEGRGTLPALRALGFTEDPGNYGVGRLAALTASGSQPTFGVGRLAPLRALGFTEDPGNYGAGRLAPLTAFGSMVPDPPDINYGFATAFQLRASGFCRPEVICAGDGTLSPLRALGSDAVNYGRGPLAPLTGRGFGLISPPTTPITIVASPGWLYITAGTPFYVEHLEDTLVLSASLATQAAYRLQDNIGLAAAVQTQSALAAVIADALTLDDHLAVAFLQVLTDSLALTDSTALTLALAALADTLVLNDSALSTLNAYQLVADAMVLIDSATGLLVLTTEDEIVLAEQLASAWTTKIDLLDSLVLDAELVGTVQLTCVLPDTFELDDSVSSTMQAISVFEDGIDFAMRLYTDQGVYVAYAMNTATRGTTRYLNYPFNSFATINGRLLGAKNNGLFALEGDTDAGVDIPWRVRTGLDNLGTTQLKRMFQAYLGYRSNGDIQLKVITTSPQGVKASYVYDVVKVRADDTRNTTAKIGKGLKSVYWSFQVQGLAGDAFALDTLSIIPLVSGRRVNG